MLLAPVAMCITALGWRIGGGIAGARVLLIAFMLALLLIGMRSHRFDRAGLTRRLDETRPDLEDSAVRGTAFRLPKSRRLLKGAKVGLLDPAGRVTDRQVVARDGRFALSCTARASGLATFSLVLRGRNGKLVEDAALPLMVVDLTKTHLLILTGAPGPEVKYLRRWAIDAGFSVNASAREEALRWAIRRSPCSQ